MSTHIVDRIEAIRFSKETIGHYDDKYLIVQLGGDSNCFESSTGRRARDWSAIHFGMAWEVIGRACSFAGDCEGGMTRFNGQSRTTPEAYIRRHRKAIDGAAVGVVEAANRGLIITARIRIPVDPTDSGDKYQLAELSKVRTPGTTTQYGTSYHVFNFDLSNPDDLKVWAANASDPAWNAAEVNGPRD